jgi:hypothetical protein
MSSCEGCQFWIIRRVNKYSDGQTIEKWSAASGKGHCDKLGIETDADFGCNKWMIDSQDHVEVLYKIGSPHHHFVMIPCPECEGKGNGTRGHRCAGTGLVRLYDDGYVGDEQTRLHPKEKAQPLQCMKCSQGLQPGWAHCPNCGYQTARMAETEVIEGLGSASI